MVPVKIKQAVFSKSSFFIFDSSKQIHLQARSSYSTQQELHSACSTVDEAGKLHETFTVSLAFSFTV